MIDEDKTEELKVEEEEAEDSDYADACAAYESLLAEAKELADKVHSLCDDIEGQVEFAADGDADDMAGRLDEIAVGLRGIASECNDLAIRIGRAL